MARRGIGVFCPGVGVDNFLGKPDSGALTTVLPHRARVVGISFFFVDGGLFFDGWTR